MDELDALADADELVQLVDGEALPAVSPFVVDEDDVMEAEALLAHVEEPHAHRAWPHHESDELRETLVTQGKVAQGQDTHKVNLEEESPVGQPVGPSIAGLAEHEVCIVRSMRHAIRVVLVDAYRTQPSRTSTR